MHFRALLRAKTIWSELGQTRNLETGQPVQGIIEGLHQRQAHGDFIFGRNTGPIVSAHGRTDGSGRDLREIEIISQGSVCLIGQFPGHF